MRKITNLLIVLGVTMLLLPAFVHANEINDTAGLASGTDLTKSINRLAKTSVDEDLGSLIYRSLPDKEQQKISSVTNLFKLVNFLYLEKKDVGTIVFLNLIIIISIAITVLLAFTKNTDHFILFSIPVFLGIFAFVHIYDMSKVKYTESYISPRSVAIETSNGLISAKVKDVVVLKDGRVSINTEKGSVITDFKSVKLL